MKLPLFIRHLLIANFIFTSFASARAAVDPELIKMRDALPEKALTVDLVVARALKNSNRFQAVKSELYRVPLAELYAEAAFDTQIEFNKSWLDNENSPSNPFSPSRNKVDLYSVGVSKYFSTGTAAELKYAQGFNELTLPGPTLTENYESKASLSVSQNLWADSFGYSSRRSLRAAKLSTEAQKLGFASTVEDWTLQMVGAFYNAWFSQAKTIAARDGYLRQERLLKVTRLRLQRGTSETPEFLQAESAYLLTKARKLEAEKNLDDQWRHLIVSLKLPLDWMNIDSIIVPLKIDNIVPEAGMLCQNFRKQGVPGKKPTALQQAELLKESALLSLESAKNKSWPDLKLVGSYFVNGVDPSRSESTEQTLNQDNPGWSVGLTLTLPIEFSLQKANVSEATANKIKAEALKNDAHDDQNLSWLNECSNIERLSETLKDAEKASRNQTRRADLEERRFKLGRSRTFDVIQAGNDATDAEIYLRSVEVEIRLTAWRVLELDARIFAKLEEFAKKHGGKVELE